MRACAFALKYSPDLLQVTTTNYNLLVTAAIAITVATIVAAFAVTGKMLKKNKTTKFQPKQQLQCVCNFITTN